MSHSMCFQPFEEHSSTQTSLRKLILPSKTEQVVEVAVAYCTRERLLFLVYELLVCALCPV